MVCSNDRWDDHQPFTRRLGEKAFTKRIPINGSIELTGKCNFSCIHCYNSCSTASELTTDEWKAILDQIADAGTLFLLITGGEPLLRQDFGELYEYIAHKGFKISLFTNGSLIDDDIIKIFRCYPPKSVEVTLYGAAEETYRRITGRDIIFNTCLRNVTLLKENGINVQIKTVFLKENFNDLDAIKTIAQDLGVRHRSDGAVFPRLNGDRAPLQHRLSVDQVVEMNLSSDDLVEEWKSMSIARQGIELPENMYSCGAAANCFHVTAQGYLQPCLMVGDIAFSLKKGSFQQGWLEELPKLWNKRMASDHKCRNCNKQYFCDYCPAIFKLETGSEDKVSQFLCEVGGEMAKKLHVS